MGKAKSADLLYVKHVSSMLVPLGHGDEHLSSVIQAFISITSKFTKYLDRHFYV